ncbi:hypothetical protein BC941DRAFT_408664 [Chlamydoabsidia padenii]|nr:hypothetical protein BC941DRAFT_408664 [Chlamydoabsidia padenii]
MLLLLLLLLFPLCMKGERGNYTLVGHIIHLRSIGQHTQKTNHPAIDPILTFKTRQSHLLSFEKILQHFTS